MRALQTMTVLPAGDHRKKSLIFGGNSNYKFGNFAPQNSVLEKQQRHKKCRM
jgi:hypothetical protein